MLFECLKFILFSSFKKHFPSTLLSSFSEARRTRSSSLSDSTVRNDDSTSSILCSRRALSDNELSVAICRSKTQIVEVNHTLMFIAYTISNNLIVIFMNQRLWPQIWIDHVFIYLYRIHNRYRLVSKQTTLRQINFSKLFRKSNFTVEQR